MISCVTLSPLTLSPHAGRGDAIAVALSCIAAVAGRRGDAALPFAPPAGEKVPTGDEGQTTPFTNLSFKQEAYHAPRS